jgi:putative ABC transport system permease protein
LTDEFFAALKEIPAFSGASLLTIAKQSFQETLDRSIGVTTTVYVVLAVIIAFGVVYNSARIQLSERGRDLATLRVLGFGRLEVSKVLFIELGTIALLAQPLGWLLGFVFANLVMRSLESELFRVPYVAERSTFVVASLVTLAAALVSALIVDRRVGRLDLIAVLKTRE